jgi:hypothetical protein
MYRIGNIGIGIRCCFFFQPFLGSFFKACPSKVSWLQRQLQPSKERSTAHSNQKLKNAFGKILPGEKKFHLTLTQEC